MNKIIGFFASKCTGLTPSNTPPCGGAFTTAVAAALALATAVDDMFENAWGNVSLARSYLSLPTSRRLNHGECSLDS